MNKKIETLYKELLKKYGKPAGQWKLWCKRPKTEIEKEEIIIGAVLTQRTNWNNVEMAITNLKKAEACSLKGVAILAQKDKKKLCQLINPSGFYQQKAERMVGLAKAILDKYGAVGKMQKRRTEELRKFLLALKGVGQETADSILLYGLEKPAFVIDEYTRRFVEKYNLAPHFSYDFLQKHFESNLERDYKLFQDFHALIIIDGKTPHGQQLLLRQL